jgi:hypothetical protein
MINSLQNWIDNAILNQLELQNENGDLPFPAWNKGYLEALRDVHAVLVDLKIADLERMKNA